MKQFLIVIKDIFTFKYKFTGNIEVVFIIQKVV